MTTRINLCTNPSFELTAAEYTGNGSVARVTTDKVFGTYSAQVATGSPTKALSYGANTAAGSLPNTYSMAATAGEQVTFSPYLKLVSGYQFYRLWIHWFNSSGALVSEVIGSNIQLNTTNWARPSHTATAPAGTVSFGVSVETLSGSTFLTDAWLIEKAGALDTYFDGSTAPGPAETNSWTGTAHASTSEKVLLPKRTNLFTNPTFEVSTLPISGAVSQALSTTQGLAFGTAHSLQMTPNTAGNNDTYASQGDTTTFYPGTAAGKTYTVSGYVTLTAPLTGTLHSRALRIVPFTRIGSGAYVEYPSTQLPNVAGTGRVSLTYTVPAGATEHFIRLYHGGSAGSGSVYWDAILLEESSTLGTYFDGSTSVADGKTRTWLGTAHSSQSIEYTGTTAATTVNIKSRESGAWVTRTAVPKVYVSGAWVTKRPKRWNGTAWVDLA